mmetsp:Transcript_25098/g.41814  ORF Transcript_25098/g.41814 Transcript_25098/m.41814 type:complete len:175 (+) Transcript_25098:125-649(+)
MLYWFYMQYLDHTPAEYEPEYFQASDGSISSTAERLPLKINIGSIQTPSLDMKVKYAGLESLLYDDLCATTVDGKSSASSSGGGGSGGRIGAASETSVFSGTSHATHPTAAAADALAAGIPGSHSLTDKMQQMAVGGVDTAETFHTDGTTGNQISPHSTQNTQEDSISRVKAFM